MALSTRSFTTNTPQTPATASTATKTIKTPTLKEVLALLIRDDVELIDLSYRVTTK
jgi:hypothetical protein